MKLNFRREFMKRKLMLLLACLFVGIGLVTAQNQKVTGTVVSEEDGLPIVGASILVKGTTIGSISDLDGKFVMANVPASAKSLIVSYIGMKKAEVAIKPTLKIVLAPDAQVVSEVVVTAMGVSREKKSLGYAVQEVKSEDLTKVGQMNVANSLSGKIAGVQISSTGGAVGASSRIVIRGNSSFGSNEPLIVVDGVPIANDQYSNTMNSDGKGGSVDMGSGLYDINPDDIESVSVLKGGSAALYGMRAGKGVILITTKSGKGKDKGVTVQYDGNFSVDQIYNILPLQNKYGQGYLGDEYQYGLAKAKGYTGTYQDYAVGGYDSGAGFNYNGVNNQMDESWGPRLDIGLKVPQFNSPYKNGAYTATDWVSHPNNIKDFFQTGYSFNHNVSFATQNEKSSTRASLGYRDQKGTVPNTDQKRYNGQFKTTMEFNKYLSYDLSMDYTRTESKNLPVTGYGPSNPLQSLLQWFGRQVDINDLKAHWQDYDVDGNHYNWNSAYHANPYWTVNKNTNGYERNRLFGKTSLYIKPLSYLKFEGRLGFDYYGTKQNSVVAYSPDYANGYFRLNNQSQSEVNADFVGYFDKTFGDFSVDALAGANYRNLKWESSGLGADELTNPELYTISNVKGSAVNSMDHSWIRSNSVYGQASMGYNGMAYVDVSARQDWSSTIKDSFFYPSVSASWIPTATFKSLQSDALSYLKIRASWAKIGSATEAYRTTAYYTSENNTFNGVSQFHLPTTHPATNLKPESVITKEIGLEAAFFQKRLTLDMAYYSKNTTNQIMNVAISRTTGYNSMLVNAGEIANKGLEIQLGADIIKNKDWNWNVSLNWAKDKSKIVSLYQDPNTGQKLSSYTLGSDWSTYVYAIPGQSWGSIYGKGMVRNDKGEVVIDSNGLPTLQSNMKLGDVAPDWIGGLRSELSYKNLSFGFLLDMRKGGDMFSVSEMFGAYTGILDFTAKGDIRERAIVVGKDVLTNVKCVTADGKANTIGIAAQDFYESYYPNRELSVFDGSFLKLRELHLTYTFPKSMLAKTKCIKAANVSLIGSNLAILWVSSSNKSHIDPESTESNGNSGVGLESNAYPPSRSFGIKLGLTF